MAPRRFAFTRAASSVEAAKQQAPLPNLHEPTTLRKGDPTPSLPSLELDSTPLFVASSPPSTTSPHSKVKAGQHDLQDGEEAAIWSSSLPLLSEITDDMEPLVTFSSPAISSCKRTSSTVKRVKVPTLLTIQLGPVTATFEIEPLTSNHSVTQYALNSSLTDKAKFEDQDGSDNGSATDVESSPRSFGASSQWSSSSSSASSSGEEDESSSMESPASFESPHAGLPSFEEIFPSFAPRTYHSLSTLSPTSRNKISPFSDISNSPKSTSRTLRRKSPPALSAEEMAYLEGKERRARLDRPTRLECGGASVFIASTTLNSASSPEKHGSWSGVNFGMAEWRPEYDDDEDILIIRNPKKGGV